MHTTTKITLLSMSMVLILSLVFTGVALAQEEPELNLRLSRDFGYASGTGKIQGSFSFRVSGPDDLARVVYFIDDQVVGESSEAPHWVQWNTDNYRPGLHTMYAVGYTSGGRKLQSNVVKAEFVSAEEGWQAGIRILGPMLALIIGAVALSMGLTFLTGRKLRNLPPGSPRNYGAAGGAICSRCERPFSRNVLSPNLLVGKLERCPFCGKWGIVRAVPRELLLNAEQAELERARADGQLAPDNVAEKIRKALEDTRYQDF